MAKHKKGDKVVASRKVGHIPKGAKGTVREVHDGPHYLVTYSGYGSAGSVYMTQNAVDPDNDNDNDLGEGVDHDAPAAGLAAVSELSGDDVQEAIASLRRPFQ